MDLYSLQQTFQSEADCRNFLTQLRWPNGVQCPHCEHKKAYRKSIPGHFKCAKCSSSFSVTSGTIFHCSKLPLLKWLIAISQIASAKKGISSLQLSRTLSVNKNTAWYIQFRVRLALQENPKFYGKFSSQIKQWKYLKKQRLQIVFRKKEKFLSRSCFNTTASTQKEKQGFQNFKILSFTTGKNICLKSISARRALIGQYHRLSFLYLDDYLREIEFKRNKTSNLVLYQILNRALC